MTIYRCTCSRTFEEREAITKHLVQFHRVPPEQVDARITEEHLERVPESRSPERTPPAILGGGFALIVGLIGLLYAATLDTSVRVGDVDLPASVRPYVSSDVSNIRIHNVGLMHQKNAYLFAGGVLALVGAIIMTTGLARGNANRS